MCIRAATIPRCSGFTTDQIGGIMGHAGDARGDVPDGRPSIGSGPQRTFCRVQKIKLTETRLSGVCPNFTATECLLLTYVDGY